MEFIVKKIGMSRTITVPSIPVTLLKVMETKVCSIIDDVALVAYDSETKKHNKSIEGQQSKFNLDKKFNKFKTLKVEDGAKAGDLNLDSLSKALIVKTSLKTKGRGFQGGMKRHGFSGGPASHGHRFGRRIGSIGNAEWPGRVQKGKKMPGQYGNTFVTVKNEVISFDSENSILVLKGSIPGFNGAKGLIKVIK